MTELTNYLAIFSELYLKYLDKLMSYIMICLEQFNRLTVWHLSVIYCVFIVLPSCIWHGNEYPGLGSTCFPIPLIPIYASSHISTNYFLAVPILGKHWHFLTSLIPPSSYAVVNARIWHQHQCPKYLLSLSLSSIILSHIHSHISHIASQLLIMLPFYLIFITCLLIHHNYPESLLTIYLLLCSSTPLSIVPLIFLILFTPFFVGQIISRNPRLATVILATAATKSVAFAFLRSQLYLLWTNHSY